MSEKIINKITFSPNDKNVTIEYFKEEYRRQIQKIVVDTAWKSLRKGRYAECIKIMYVDYYLDYEPHNVLVAIDNETKQVAGYIVCSTDAKLFLESQRKIYIPKLRRLSLILSSFHKICVKKSHELDVLYGGGFHINVSVDFQSKGIGPSLMKSMATHLKANGVNHMYLITQNRKTKGYGFYTHIGFKEVKKYFLGSIALVIDNETLINR